MLNIALSRCSARSSRPRRESLPSRFWIMSAPQLSLLAKRRFLPLFTTQFLGAFNDNLYRSAMLFLVSFGLYRGNADKAALVAVIAGGVFILPYFLFSSVAGQLADRLDKARIAQSARVPEI